MTNWRTGELAKVTMVDKKSDPCETPAGNSTPELISGRQAPKPPRVKDVLAPVIYLPSDRRILDAAHMFWGSFARSAVVSKRVKRPTSLQAITWEQ
jgi:hypothetical protein